MVKNLSKALFTKMLTNAQTVIEEKFDYLNELDSATGDGDHGTAIVSTMRAAVEATKVDATFSQLLSNIGWGIMSATGGSTSSLLGSFYLGMSELVRKEELSSVEVASMFKAGLDSVLTMTTARVGDKTMMDVLIPTIGAMNEVSQSNPALPILDLFTAAAEAAQKGAESTRDLVAKQGRARNLGERSRGHYDAGAVSQSLIFESFVKTIKDET